ncbi:MAG: NUDIX hydrolase [Desulfobulbaceae bacterium]|jgi:8-oxo-dGTP diphosphatase|nr:NUDIX hydrolase [Desulfobulbaceae bacterium]
MYCPHCQQEIAAYRNPAATVDIIIEIDGKIVLIKRKNPPFGWALPGGFVDYGESFEWAAEREALEETNLVVTGLKQFHTYSRPDRDTRQHTASTVYVAQAEGIPKAGDDAGDAALFTENNLPPLAFDHAEILTDYYVAKKAGKGRPDK